MMIHLKTFKLFENLTLNIPYYHGTNKTLLGEKIYEDGILKPGIEVTSKKMLAPIANRVYMTPSISHAIIYAIGAAMIGKKLSDIELSKGQYGYVTITNNLEVERCVPDEDYVGLAVHYIMNHATDDLRYVSEYDKAFRINLATWSDKELLLNFAYHNLTDNQIKQIKRYENYNHLAIIGKKLISKMPRRLIESFLELRSPVACYGSVSFDEMWKFDKNLNELLNIDGSNFFELAQRIV